MDSDAGWELKFEKSHISVVYACARLVDVSGYSVLSLCSQGQRSGPQLWKKHGSSLEKKVQMEDPNSTGCCENTPQTVSRSYTGTLM